VSLPPAEVVRYGEHPDQIANLHAPAREGGPWPAIVLVHGGYWRERFDRTTLTPVACDLAARGYLAWNVEYRRVGQEGGGWPGTFDDVAAAADRLVAVPAANTSAVVAVGHSAGGHLALWLAARRRLPAGTPGALPRLQPRAVVSLAGVADLARGFEANLGGGACSDLLGGGLDEVPERYAWASPAALLPLGIQQLVVHGDQDEPVPIDQSSTYVANARAAGDEIEFLEFAGADHFDVIDTRHAAWAAVVERLPGLLASVPTY
jgi:acetyl esterase/lipase